MIDVGQTIGNYRIASRLGEGGMGVVYLAEHPVIGKKVALKAIHPELSRNAEVVSRFIQEAKSVNQIGHEHIVDIADFGTTPGGEFYFIMEYLQGEALSDRLKREGRLDPTRAMVIGAQIADALDASHEHGIIHRDLKPENIFLVSRGGSKDFVKVLDFGLAKLTDTEEKVSHKTRAGTVMGTPYYMAPEQCEGKAEIDPRADIYSLGVLMFEMLTGKVPPAATATERSSPGTSRCRRRRCSLVPELTPELDLILSARQGRTQRFRRWPSCPARSNRYASALPSSPCRRSVGASRAPASPIPRSEMHIQKTRRLRLGQRQRRRRRPPIGHGALDVPTGHGRDHPGPDAPQEDEPRSALRDRRDDGRRHLSDREQLAARDAPAGAHRGVALPTGDGARELQFRSRRRHDHDGRREDAGPTPLFIEVPAQRLCCQYRFAAGLRAKTMYIVPNLPCRLRDVRERRSPRPARRRRRPPQAREPRRRRLRAAHGRPSNGKAGPTTTRSRNPLPLDQGP
jgi:serine/threonine protein kinase